MPHRPDALPTPSPAVQRGVYCLREPVNGLWAYYAVTSWGMLTHPPRPAEAGEDAAFVIADLADELDEIDAPVSPPHLRLVRAAVVSSPSTSL